MTAKVCKTPRCILEEAATSVGTDISELDPNEAMRMKRYGWLKGSEYEMGTYLPGGKATLVGVCSIGAIALASLDKYQLGSTMKPIAFPSFDVIAGRDANTLLAALYLTRAIKSRIRWNRLAASSTNDGSHEKFDDMIHAWGWENLMSLARMVEAPRLSLPWHDCKKKTPCFFDQKELLRLELTNRTGSLIAHFNDNGRTTWEDVDGAFIKAIKLAIIDEEKVD